MRFAPTQDGLGLQNTKHHMCGTTMCQIWLLFFFLAFHCVKCVRIRSNSGPNFSRIFPHSDWIQRDTEYLQYSVRMRENAGKMRTRITPKTDVFYTVFMTFVAATKCISVIKQFMDNRRSLVLNTFYIPQFNFWRIVWVCHNRTLNKNIDHLQEDPSV